MAGKNTAVFGIYPSAARAEDSVDALIAAGFPEHRHLGTLNRTARAPGNSHTKRKPKPRKVQP